MKNLFTLTLLFFFIGIIQINAQCDYLGGSFETWEDGTLEIDSTGTLPANTIVSPSAHFSIVRFLFMVFGSSFEVGTPEFLDYWSNGFGLSADDDAFAGNKAMRIGGDSVFSFADAHTFIPCKTAPKFIQFSYKHVGTGTDSLYIQSLASTEMPNLFNDLDTNQLAAYVIKEIISNTDEGEYSTIKLPFKDNPSITDVDTISTSFIVAGNEVFFGNGGESYFLIDDVKFLYQDSPTLNIEAFSVNVFPNPASKMLTISVEKPVEMEVFNIYGQLIQKNNLHINENQIHCADWNSGNYILKLTDKENLTTFRKVVIE